MNRQRVGLRSPRMVAAVMLVLLVLFKLNVAPVCAAQEDDVDVGDDAKSSWDDHEDELDSNEDGPGFDLKAPMKMPDDTLMHFIEGADGRSMAGILRYLNMWSMTRAPMWMVTITTQCLTLTRTHHRQSFRRTLMGMSSQ